MDRGDVERLFQRLTLEGALNEKCVTNGAGYTSAYLNVRSFRCVSAVWAEDMRAQIGPRYQEILSGRKQVMLTVSIGGGAKGKKPATKAKAKTGSKTPAAALAYDSDIDDDDLEQEVAKVWPPARTKTLAAALSKDKGKAPIVLDLDDDDDEVVVEDAQAICYKDLKGLRASVCSPSHPL